MATWLEQVNAYRSLGNLPPVTEDPALSNADRNLAEYEVRNLTVLSHLNDQPNNPNYTAAQSSNIWGSSDPNASDAQAIQDWMGGVFHGIQIIDPRLKTVGFGSYRTTGNTPYFKMVAALNTVQGLDSRATPQYPIMWPAQAKTFPLTTYREEVPDARSKCSYGYGSGVTPQLAGQPLFLLLGPGNVTGSVTSSLRLETGTGMSLVPVCEIDGSNYTHPDPNLQALGRIILAARGAVVLLPMAPLAIGTYAVDITVNNQLYSWVFSVGTTISITVDPIGIPDKIYIGQTVQGQWMARGGQGGPYTFSSDPPPNGVSISPQGVLSGVVQWPQGISSHVIPPELKDSPLLIGINRILARDSADQWSIPTYWNYGLYGPK